MITCYFCRGEMIERQTTFVHEDDGLFWIIRNVPGYVCTQCGEKEYSQETTRRVLALLSQPPRPRDIVHVPAYELAAA